MKKQDQLLLLIAISGELPAYLASVVVGSDSYAAALITRLKQEGYISVRSKEGCKGYVLRAKARRYLLAVYDTDTAFFLCGGSNTSHVKSDRDKRLRLHRMSEVWVFLWKAGVCIFRSQKQNLTFVSGKNGEEKAAYYGSLEFKGAYDVIKGSRACGVLLSGKSAYVVYNTKAQRMKWAKKMERSMRVWTEKLLLQKGRFGMADALMLGYDPPFLVELLESDGGIKNDLFQADDIYEHYYYVPMIRESMVQIWLLTDKEKRERLYQFLCGILNRREKEYAVCDGYDDRGIPVYFCHELELRQLLRIKQEINWQRKGIIVCLDYQEEALKTYFGEGVRIQTVITKKLKEYLQQDV